MNIALIIIGGLDDGRMLLWPVRWLWEWWGRAYGIKVVPYYMGWKKFGEETFEGKIAEVIELVRKLKQEGYSVSLLGMSAGASAAFNVYYQCREDVDCLINCCGRLRKGGPEVKIRTLDLAARNSKLFRRSVLECEAGLNSFTAEDLTKILTLRSCLDEIVPAQTTVIAGARNVLVPFVEHTLSIIFAMTVYSRVIAGFVRRTN